MSSKERTREVFTAEARDTERIGALLAGRATAGARIYLQGELGAGKTTLVRGFLRGLGFTGTVRSPTFTLIETYDLQPFPVYHFDLYRLAQPAELEGIGYRDYFDGAGVCLVEWPERAAAQLAVPDLHVALRIEEQGRRLFLEARSPVGAALLEF